MAKRTSVEDYFKLIKDLTFKLVSINIGMDPIKDMYIVLKGFFKN